MKRIHHKLRTELKIWESWCDNSLMLPNGNVVQCQLPKVMDCDDQAEAYAVASKLFRSEPLLSQHDFDSSFH